MFAPLLREYRKHRMARFTFWVLAYGAALWLVDRFRGDVPGLWSIFWLALIVAGVYYLFRFGKFIKRHLLWHLRRRLILTYFFIAVVPILLILGLVGLGLYIINGQFASFLVASKFRNRADELQQLSRLVSHQLDHLPSGTPAARLDQLQGFVMTDLREHSASYPGLEISLRLGSAARAFRLDAGSPPPLVSAPAWLKTDDFAGIVLDGGQLVLRALDRRPTEEGPFTIILSQPVSPELLDQVGQGIGPIGLLKARTLRAGEQRPNVVITTTTPQGQTVEETSETIVRSKSLQVPPPANRFDWMVYNVATLDPISWNGLYGRPDEAGGGAFYVSTRILTLDRQLVSSLGQFSNLYWVAFAVVAVLFLILELVALVIGVQLTRSITTTVDKLHLATERVKAGDFSHRINLPARDQLTALGGAFDGMTASVERLLRESLEKTRLEGELEIAREVQNSLFPQTVPEVPGLRLYGVCKPARVVSGDYYDFLRLSEGRIGLVLGDISGKGISAALLMASIQSALHAQFYTNGNRSAGTAHAVPISPISTGEVVSRLNRQLFASTPREKYVTFFYAVYDPQTRKMSYTNAGHLPPVLFRSGRIERLEAGGTVVGLFPVARYEQAEIQLEPGDTLLAYTDGMTEPENSYGEEFGEERLLEVAGRTLSSSPEAMVEEIYRSVSDWTGSPELQDDMTLMIAKAMP